MNLVILHYKGAYNLYSELTGRTHFNAALSEAQVTAFLGPTVEAARSTAFREAMDRARAFGTSRPGVAGLEALVASNRAGLDGTCLPYKTFVNRFMTIRATQDSEWVGVDLDGTVAHYDKWVTHTDIGKPVEAMVERVRGWRSQGTEVRIFTARVYPINMCVATRDFRYPVSFFQAPAYVRAMESIQSIQDWCLEHLGEVLPVTNIKDHLMLELWDDRAYRVERNTGKQI